ncbi:MFS transporter [Paragemmobacter straminiformis]|uniref:MFS transporter n=1 Tax=Paragemmobacter straminiformis TaxID=2045119 RepID=A0A842I7Z0_9RHOB|nr:MFS transporter [Gemmobacter straminiformis]MBC2835477.1 MFS transporter [Gemmobacter straminiformis]
MNLSRSFPVRHKDFGLFWAGIFLVNIAVQIEAVTIGWQIYGIGRQTMSIGESAFLVGMVGLAQFVPLFLLTLWAGSLADRHSRRGIVMLALLVEAVCVLGLVGVALEPSPNVSHIFAIAAVFGAARAFLSPASSATVPMLVPKSEMPQAISLKSLAWQTAVIIGPWIGGLLCAISTATSYGVTAALYLAGLAIILFIRTNTTPERQPGSQIQQIKEGLVYTWQNKIIFGAISLDLFAVLLGGATALLPAFASDILQVGPEGFGILRSGPALGAVVMALALSRWPLKRKAGARMFLAVGAFGLATIVFALSRNMWLSVIALAALGAADMISVYVRQTLVQIVTPDHMRGRVSSVSGLFISGSNELGEFESGVVSRFIGPVAAAVVGGIGTIGVTGLWAWMFPDLRRADRLDGADETGPITAHSATTPASTGG